MKSNIIAYTCSCCGKDIYYEQEGDDLSVNSNCIRGGLGNEVLKDNICDDCVELTRLGVINFADNKIKGMTR